jgi:hypothetical protein
MHMCVSEGPEGEGMGKGAYQKAKRLRKRKEGAKV